MLNAERKSTNSNLTVLGWSRRVRAVWSVVLTASSVDLVARQANWCGSRSAGTADVM